MPTRALETSLRPLAGRLDHREKVVDAVDAIARGVCTTLLSSPTSLADPRLIRFGGRLTALVVERVAEERVRRALAEIKQPAPDPDSWEQLDIVDKTQAPMS